MRFIEKLVEVVSAHTVPDLTYEEVEFGTLIVLVDAFIACKVLEPPR
jgi:hypothetical protein